MVHKLGSNTFSLWKNFFSFFEFFLVLRLAVWDSLFVFLPPMCLRNLISSTQWEWGILLCLLTHVDLAEGNLFIYLKAETTSMLLLPSPTNDYCKHLYNWQKMCFLERTLFYKIPSQFCFFVGYLMLNPTL